MNAYLYCGSLYCARCIVEACIAHKLLAPAARDIGAERALNQAREANGWTSESDYDSNDFPKGPFADGGGESDTPSHCDDCNVFLENPLTFEGVAYVEETLREHRAKVGLSRAEEILSQWAEFYGL